ncbi:MAG: hypothetical protein WAT20_01690 [Ferruginibacter sp.]
MKKRLDFYVTLFLFLFFFGLFTFNTNNLLAQGSESPVSIYVRIIETGFNDIKDKGKNNLVWKFYRGAGCNEDSVLTNPKFETCIRLKTKKNSKTKEISDEKDDLRPFPAGISGFKITMEAFLNKKGGEKCFSDPKDSHYGIKTEEIRTDNLVPGIWSEEIRITDAFGRFFAIIVYKYELIYGLSEIEFGGNKIMDVSKNTELSLPIKLPKKETLSFSWSYSTEDQNDFTTIPNSAEDKSKIVFNPLKNIFGNEPLLRSKKVDFKAEVQIGGKTETSKELKLTFVPPPPSFEKEKDILLIPACNGLANGGIDIKNIKTASSAVKYVLQKKTEAGAACRLKDPSAEVCTGFADSGTVLSGKILKIRSLAAGDYILYIFNGDIESGEVNIPTEFTISDLAPLKILDTESSSKDPTCLNAKGGDIYMTLEGGKNLWQIVILPNKGDMTWEGNTLSFKNLEAGDYTVYLSNQCGPEISKTFKLKKPKQISIDLGSISIKQDKTGSLVMFDVLNGSNNYRIKVTDPENSITESENIFLMKIEIPISKTGIYIIEITDNANPQCAPARVSIKIDKPAGKFKHKVIE